MVSHILKPIQREDRICPKVGAFYHENTTPPFYFMIIGMGTLFLHFMQTLNIFTSFIV